MKPAVAYTLGVISGIAATVGFFFWSQLTAPAVSTTPSSETASHTVAAPPLSPATSSDSGSLDFSSSSGPSLESALKEIEEAGMVVIPQEFARFLMPSLLSTDPQPAVRQILQLDNGEAVALGKARMNYDRALQQTVDAHLQVIEVKDGIVTATLPAFKEERQKLIDAWRTESLAVLDEESAAIAAHIDFNRATGGIHQGGMDLTVTFKPSQNSKHVAIEYRGQAANGDQRQTYHLQTGMPGVQLLKQFPSLQAHFPHFSEETKP